MTTYYIADIDYHLSKDDEPFNEAAEAANVQVDYTTDRVLKLSSTDIVALVDFMNTWWDDGSGTPAVDGWPIESDRA